MSMWERVRRFDGPFIGQRHRKCQVCDRRFLTGVIQVERGHSVGAICHTCVASGATRQLTLRDLFPARISDPRA